MKRVYLDHSATTPVHPSVIETMVKSLTEDYGNPSSIHAFGRSAHARLEKSREQIAQQIGAKADEIFFTSGGTESNNWAFYQLKHASVSRPHLITTKVEHPSVLHTAEFYEQAGIEVTYLEVDRHGNISIEALKNALRPETVLVSIMMVNNEVGVRYPIREIGQLLHDHPAKFHTDAVQALGHEVINVQELGVDFLSATAHKLNGPKGVGLFYARTGTPLHAMLHGGEQELKRRPGTENLPGIMGFTQALTRLNPTIQMDNQARYQKFQETIITALSEARVDFHVNGAKAPKSPHILNLNLKGIPSQQILMQLDLQGFAISVGSACTAGNIEPSHVLTAMYGEGHPAINESVRISFGEGVTEEDVEHFAAALVKICRKRQQID